MEIKDGAKDGINRKEMLNDFERVGLRVVEIQTTTDNYKNFADSELMLLRKALNSHIKGILQDFFTVARLFKEAVGESDYDRNDFGIRVELGSTISRIQKTQQIYHEYVKYIKESDEYKEYLGLVEFYANAENHHPIDVLHPELKSDADKIMECLGENPGALMIVERLLDIDLPMRLSNGKVCRFKNQIDLYIKYIKSHQAYLTEEGLLLEIDKIIAPLGMTISVYETELTYKASILEKDKIWCVCEYNGSNISKNKAIILNEIFSRLRGIGKEGYMRTHEVISDTGACMMYTFT